jgi:hypothetical protein
VILARRQRRLDEVTGVVEAITGPGHDLRSDGRLVGLQDLTGRQVELDAVSIVRDVAAGDHQAGDTLAKGKVGKCRARYIATVDRLVAELADRLCARSQDARTARPDVGGQRDLVARVQRPAALQILQETHGV